MMLSIFISALIGGAVGYSLMKLELKSLQHEKERKILEFVSQGLAIAVCVLPFFLFGFSAAFVIVTLIAVASLRKILAAIIFIGGVGYLFGSWEGLFAIYICLGVLIIPIALIFKMVRYNFTSKQYTSLGIGDNEPAPKINEDNTYPVRRISLRNMAIYCSLFIVFTKSIPLEVNVIQSLYSKKKALPILVQAASNGQYGAFSALKGYGTEALQLELELLRNKFQEINATVDSNDQSSDYQIAELTSNILEIGEAGSLSQFGENQKKALRAAVIHSSNPASSIAITELVKLNAIPDLVSSLDSRNAEEVTQALLQFHPSETIPLLMKWQLNGKESGYNEGTGYYSRKDEYYSAEFAKYGLRAVPELIPYLGDENKKVRLFTTQIFRKIGPRAIPVLKSLLDSNNFLIVNQAAYILGMSGEKSAVPILIKKIEQEEDDDDGSLAEALSNISDERATQFFISDYQVWKDSLEKGKQWEELDENEIYDESIARTKTALAKSFLESAALQSKSLTYRKHLIQLFEIYFWKGTNKAKMGSLVEALQNSSAEQSQLTAVELSKMGDPVVLPFLIEADKRAHKTGTPIENCEIHKSIAAFSK